MSEQEPYLEQRSWPQHVILAGENGYSQAFIYQEPGWLDLAREQTAGLTPSRPGRSMLVTDEGRFVVIKGYFIDIEQTLSTGTAIISPIPHSLRTECKITIGQPFGTGEFQLSPVREVIVDKLSQALPASPGERLQNPFEGEVGTIISLVGHNSAALRRPSVETQQPNQDYL